MLTRAIRIQLVIFTIVTVLAIVILGWYYLRVPRLVGIGQYTLYADLPASGGLYKTSNVTYRGIQIGKVTAVAPTESGVRATMSIDDRYKIPVDASANVHSVSAVGEQYLDLVSTASPRQYFADGADEWLTLWGPGRAGRESGHLLAFVTAPRWRYAGPSLLQR